LGTHEVRPAASEGRHENTPVCSWRYPTHDIVGASVDAGHWHPGDSTVLASRVGPACGALVFGHQGPSTPFSFQTSALTDPAATRAARPSTAASSTESGTQPRTRPPSAVRFTPTPMRPRSRRCHARSAAQPDRLAGGDHAVAAGRLGGVEGAVGRL